MKYPMAVNWLSFKKMDKDYVEITDELLKCKHTVNIQLYRFIKKLDGKTDPYNLGYTENVVNQMLDRLEENELIRYSRFLIKEKGLIMFSLYFPHTTRWKRLFSFLLNFLLCILFIPVFLFGAIEFYRNIANIPIAQMNTTFLLGELVGTICGVFLHEFGHAVATWGAVGAKGKVFEIGVFLQTYIVPGAYTLSDIREDEGLLLKRVQMYAAGIETNFLLSGAAYYVASRGVLPNFFEAFALSNLMLAILNMLFIDGLDGQKIISELLCGNIDFFSNTNKNGIFELIFKRDMFSNKIAAISVWFTKNTVKFFLPVLYILSLILLVV